MAQGASPSAAERLENGTLTVTVDPKDGLLSVTDRRTGRAWRGAAAAKGAKIIILDVPLLYETGMDALCDETWVLYIDREIQISRIVARDGLTREQAEARIDSMMSNEDRNARATHAINTDQPLEKTRQMLSQLYQQALKAAEARG